MTVNEHRDRLLRPFELCLHARRDVDAIESQFEYFPKHVGLLEPVREGCIELRLSILTIKSDDRVRWLPLGTRKRHHRGRCMQIVVALDSQ